MKRQLLSFLLLLGLLSACSSPPLQSADPGLSDDAEGVVLTEGTLPPYEQMRDLTRDEITMLAFRYEQEPATIVRAVWVIPLSNSAGHAAAFHTNDGQMQSAEGRITGGRIVTRHIIHGSMRFKQFVGQSSEGNARFDIETEVPAGKTYYFYTAPVYVSDPFACCQDSVSRRKTAARYDKQPVGYVFWYQDRTER